MGFIASLISAISSKIVFQLFPEVYITRPFEIFKSPIAIFKSSMGASAGSSVLEGEVWLDTSLASKFRCSGDCDDSVFEGGEFEWRTCAARSVTRASNRCIRCCKKSLDPGFAPRDLLPRLAYIRSGGVRLVREWFSEFTSIGIASLDTCCTGVFTITSTEVSLGQWVSLDLNLRRRHSLQETGMRFRFLTWRLPLEVFVSSESRRSEDCAAWEGSSRSSILLDIVFVVQQFKTWRI